VFVLWSVVAVGSMIGCGGGLDPDLGLDDVDADGDGAVARLDCDDGDAAVYPGATEICDDGIDNDCDGAIDDAGIGAVEVYIDNDGDGYGLDDDMRFACPSSLEGTWAERGGDCNDRDPKVHPDSTEICDGVDQDCDGTVDDGFSTATYWADADGDGYGAGASVEWCEPREGWVEIGGDCDDGAVGTYPGSVDVCDGVDNDCSGEADDAGTASIGATVYGTLDEAIDAALMVDTASIDVCAGQFELSTPIRVNPSKALELRGQGPTATTISLATNKPWVTVYTKGELAIRDLGIDGTGSSTSIVSARSNGSFYAENIHFGEFGSHPIRGDLADLTPLFRIERSRFVGTGRVLRTVGAAQVEIIDTVFDHNDCRVQGDGVVVIESTSTGAAPTLTITDSSFSNSYAFSGVLRLLAEPGEPRVSATLTNTAFVDNESNTDHGSIVLERADLVGVGLSITGNMGAPAQGGGITATSSTVSGAEIIDSQAFFGGAIWAHDSEISDVTVRNNRAWFGGAIYLSDSVLLRSTVTDNEAQEDGGGVYLTSDGGTGSTMDDTDVVDNHATRGGGLYVGADGGVTYDVVGGTVHSNTASERAPGLYFYRGAVHSSAHFGDPADPLTDNGLGEVVYQNAAGEYVEFEVFDEPFRIDGGIHSFQ